MVLKNERKIILAPVHFQRSLLTPFIFEKLQVIFKRDVYLTTPEIDMENFYEPARDQYHSTAILKHLIQNTTVEESRICLLVNEDLFIPILTFVFGEAHMNGHYAIVSSHRLRESFYMRQEDQDLLRARLLKEIVHELGHTFGLIHCFDDLCVMKNSYNIEDTDRKDIYPCEMCFQKLDAAL